MKSYFYYKNHLQTTIYQADNLEVLHRLTDKTIDFIYIDPPFNTGKIQKRARNDMAYQDQFDDFLSFLKPRLTEAHRLLKDTGSLFFHIDHRESHYCKVLLDEIFGRPSFMNEIIWAYDYGGRSKRKWSAKHDTLFWYAKDPNNYTFNYAEIDRIPYMAPGLVGKEKAAVGKVDCTTVWWHTIVPTNSTEKTGYPTQKPLGVVSKIIKVHTHPRDLVLDFFAGSGTTGEAALRLGRQPILVDSNPQAIAVIHQRLTPYIL